MRARQTSSLGQLPEQCTHISHGDWIRLLTGNGFEVVDLTEVYPPEGATTRYTFVENSIAVVSGHSTRSTRTAPRLPTEPGQGCSLSTGSS